MRNASVSLLALLAVVGCEAGSEPTAVTDVAYVVAPAVSRNATAHMSGDQEAPTPVVTLARGAAKFQLSKDGQSITYRVNAANIQNVIMSHIHLGEVGVAGPIVVWLYPDAPPPQLIPGRFQGTLATGTITEEDLVGPLADATLEDLWTAIRAGVTYVNVHTLANMPGEIRGQIDAAGQFN